MNGNIPWKNDLPYLEYFAEAIKAVVEVFYRTI